CDTHERARRGEGFFRNLYAARRGNDEPDDECEKDRQQLEGETAEETVPHRHTPKRCVRTRRSASRSRFSCSAPSAATAIDPFSSLITIISASLSSLNPRAARCRVPCPSLASADDVSGRNAPAATMRSRRTITAPS